MRSGVGGLGNFGGGEGVKLYIENKNRAEMQPIWDKAGFDPQNAI